MKFGGDGKIISTKFQKNKIRLPLKISARSIEDSPLFKKNKDSPFWWVSGWTLSMKFGNLLLTHNVEQKVCMHPWVLVMCFNRPEP